MTERTLDMRTRIARRRMLAGLGALSVAVASPIWRVATAFGQDQQPRRMAKRFIGLFSANGTIASAFFPAIRDREAQLTAASLPRILQPLQKHVAQLAVLKGVHMNSTIEDELGVSGANKPGGPHMKGPGAMLTGGSLLAGSFTGAGGPAGWADRISVDQLIVQRAAAGSRFPSLELGVRIQGQEPLRVISYRGANQPNQPVDDPWQLYARLFAGKDLPESELARTLAERRSVLDFLQDDLQRLQTRLAASDRARLDAHLTGLRGLEQRLGDGKNTCQPMTLPDKLDPQDMANYPTISKLQIDLMVLAQSCDLTRVATMMWANADSWQYYPWIGVNEEHHALSHSSDDDAASTEKLIKINVWHAEQVNYLLDSLAALPAADGGTMLDETVVLWGNELGVGNSHTYQNIPWLLAGGANGYFKLGRALQFPDRPHNDLLLSICHAFGFEDVTSFGIPGVCTGPLTELVS